MSSIKKINELEVIESFIQTNYSHGFKYIDKAGELVNFFHEDGKIPHFSMSQEKLELNNSQTNSSIRVSPVAFWMNFHYPPSFDFVLDKYIIFFEFISKTLSLKNFSRLGIRNYFGYSPKEGSINEVSHLAEIGSLNLNNITYSGEINGLQIRFSVTTEIEIKKSNEVVSSDSILFDIDIHKKGDFTSLKEVKNVGKDIINAYRSEELLEIINSILQK